MTTVTAAPKIEYISVEDYLEGELVSQVKREYLGGVVYPMAGARNVHNLIASNVLGTLHARPRGKLCARTTPIPKSEFNCPRRCGSTIPTAQSFAGRILPPIPFKTNLP